MGLFSGVFNKNRNRLKGDDILSEELKHKFMTKKVDGKLDLSTTAPEEKILDDGAVYLNTINRYLNSNNQAETPVSSPENIITCRNMVTSDIDARIAVDSIKDEAIIKNGKNAPVQMDIYDNLNVTDEFRQTLTDEWKYVASNLLNLNERADEYFDISFVNGSIYSENVYDNSDMSKGIVKVNILDTIGLVKGIRDFQRTYDNGKKEQISKEVWYYSEAATAYHTGNTVNSMFKRTSNDGTNWFTPEQISSGNSGLIDGMTGSYYSYLNYAIKPLNQLKSVENAMVLFALTRSTEKMVYYVDTGNLPEAKVRAKIEDMITHNTTQQKYDNNSGRVVDTPDKIKINTEMFLPRRNGNKGTEIVNLSADRLDIGSLDILRYLRDKFSKALQSPTARTEKSTTINIGYTNDVSYEEMARHKFILKLRSKFTPWIKDIYSKHLISKGIVTIDEWDNIKNDINIYCYDDGNYEKMKFIYELREKIETIATMEPFTKPNYVDPSTGEPSVKCFTVEEDIIQKVMCLPEADFLEWKERFDKIEADNAKEVEQIKKEFLTAEQGVDGEPTPNKTVKPTDDKPKPKIDKVKTESYKSLMEEFNDMNTENPISINDDDTLDAMLENIKLGDDIVIIRDGKEQNKITITAQ